MVGENSSPTCRTNGRSFLDFTLTTPGVVRDVRGGGLSFAGQRGTSNSLIVDGADNSNTFFGQTTGRTGVRSPYQFSQDAVREFQVNRSAYLAEYGRAGGAVINVVTKSGTNEYHGNGFYFYRDKSLNAKDYIDAVNGREKAPYHFDQFGASLGGRSSRTRSSFSPTTTASEIPFRTLSCSLDPGGHAVRSGHAGGNRQAPEPGGELEPEPESGHLPPEGRLGGRFRQPPGGALQPPEVRPESAMRTAASRTRSSTPETHSSAATRWRRTSRPR